ncbi:MAG: hemolysin III family protein [Gaiellaceae bacterium]
MAATVVGELTKPRLRGVLHHIAFVVALVVAPFAIVGADGRLARAGVAVFATSVAACFGASALYHRVSWNPTARRWMRRLDHAGVYLLIAGTYTPVALLGLHGMWREAILAIVWGGALVAIVVKFAWVDAPKWVAAAIGLALGWVAVVALPQLVVGIPPAAMALLVIGGIAYTVGALVYAACRPDPFPAVFGYHEVFHALTIFAVACQYVAIALFVAQTP